MARRLVRIVIAALVALLLAAAIGLGLAHRQIRREHAALPSLDAVLASRSDAGPVRASWIDSASQPMPRAGVLTPSLDPTPDAPYVMSHPAFVLEWSDGRTLLVDAGMERDAALALGRNIERLGGGRPLEAHGSLVEQMPALTSAAGGIVFTHLHVDHVGGIAALCRTRTAPLPVFMTAAQDERPNYTTRPGRRMIADAPCARATRLDGEGLLPVPGFPGVLVVEVDGHTPGSQVVIVWLASETGPKGLVVVGDVANALDGVLHDVAKPAAYRWLVVPEDEARQREVRGWLRALGERGLALLVNHDRLALERSGIPRR